ncbi:SMP-30/gluconolactonase/LRE family protein [Aquimarina sp. U1-2]|uniref:SMP-30/gluconolactonase/LRE family protein n=1 Tax=Aquimarina sp. U1-2 TaxID=2823141 RepID=UPI001AEC89D5|nr:SMP-30/gluconolactonase/LRE family protein [Aquimarina sp. U1-2]MBP2833171.1 SMP-30/gluconolactonase/LRE family protein [Aquimarina sp. U1-2]
MKIRPKKSTHLKRAIVFLSFGFTILLSSCYGDGIDPDPEVETLISNFAANGAVSVDRQGTIYVSEYGRFVETGGSGTRVFKLSPHGKVLDTITGLSGPMGTAKDSKGNLFINNDNNTVRGQVLKISPNKEREVIASIEGWPSSMAIDYEDNLYISNYTAPTVHKITPDGTVSVYAEDPRLLGGVGIDLDSKGNVIVANFYTATIYSIDKNGEVSLIANIPDIVIQNFGIGYITVINDVIYATGIAVNYIYSVSMDGTIETIAGNGEAAQVDGPLLEASFSNPNGIAANKFRKTLYISEYTGVGGVRKIKL